MLSNEFAALLDSPAYDLSSASTPQLPRRIAIPRAEAERIADSALRLKAPRRSSADPVDFSVAPAGNLSLVYLAAKRAIDIFGALALLVFLAPIMVGTFLVLLVTTKGRPFFCQERVGYCGRRFWMLKFRTMCLDAACRQAQVANEQDGPVFKNRRDPRITRFGRILRSFSIDETPQLFNVLAGQMSLVGPRPPVPSEVAQYELWQRQRLAVKPGLTCLWQVSGRCEIGFEQWVRMDLWYIRNQSLLTDLKLLLATPASVLSRRGAY
jgi:lipopolysaccharide/colanic/teichoic acid biosynthesis glycosyltransferase